MRGCLKCGHDKERAAVFVIGDALTVIVAVVAVVVFVIVVIIIIVVAISVAIKVSFSNTYLLSTQRWTCVCCGFKWAHQAVIDVGTEEAAYNRTNITIKCF